MVAKMYNIIRFNNNKLEFYAIAKRTWQETQPKAPIKGIANTALSTMTAATGLKNVDLGVSTVNVYLVPSFSDEMLKNNETAIASVSEYTRTF